MRKIFSILVLIAIFAVTAPAQAELIGHGTWTPVDPAQVNADGGQFWDSVSFDGAGCNIGQLLSGAGGCGGLNGFGMSWLEYFHNDGAPTQFMFKDVSSVTYLGGVTARNTENSSELWGPWVPQTMLFSSGSQPGDTFKISREYLYGLHYTIAYSPTKEFKTTGPLTSLFTPQHFALFRVYTPYFTDYYLGIEDLLPHEDSDWDHNDAIFRIRESRYGPGPFPPPVSFDFPAGFPTDSCASPFEDEAPCGYGSLDPTDPEDPDHPVPEPATLALLGLGLFGARYLRRQNK